MEWDTQISKMCAAVNDVAEAISVKHPELAIGIAESSDSMASWSTHGNSWIVMEVSTFTKAL